MGVPMRHPYTLLGKLSQFPYKFMWKNGRLLRYTVYAWFACAPLFYCIGKAGEGNIYGSQVCVIIRMLHSILWT